MYQTKEMQVYLRLGHDEALFVCALGVLVLLVVLRPEAVAQLVDEGEVGLLHGAVLECQTEMFE